MPSLDDDVTLIIDECVSGQQLTRFKCYAEEQGICFNKELMVSAQYSGMPDAQIIHHLLNKQTLLLTNDRPFHNKVLSKSLRSYFVDDDSITYNALAGIKVKADTPLTKKTKELKSNYRHVNPQIRYALLPSSNKDLKRLSKKCRRIRNHFDGLDNLERVAVTVSRRTFNGAQLIGVKIRVSSTVGLEALDASESYILEACEPKQAGLIALNYSLITVILLMLNGVKTEIFFDADAITLPDISDQSEVAKNDYLALYSKLSDTFTQLAFTSVHKGARIEKLRLRLFDLIRSDSNEIKLGNIKDAINNCL
ncbi:MAG TPA: hypothetical protein VIC26_05970 [Marinagarivorans sp.]